MGGLWQACAQTIHGDYYIWVENPFFMFVWIVIVWGDMGKPMNTTTMLDMCGMNNNNNDNIVSFVLSKSPLDILSLNHNDCSVVSTKRFPDHCRRPGSDSLGRSYWPSVLIRAIDSDSMLFLERCYYCCWCKMVVAYHRNWEYLLLLPTGYDMKSTSWWFE